MQDGASWSSKMLPRQSAQLVHVLGRRPNAIATPSISGACPSIAFRHHHLKALQILNRLRQFRCSKARTTMGEQDQILVPILWHGDEEGRTSARHTREALGLLRQKRRARRCTLLPRRGRLRPK